MGPEEGALGQESENGAYNPALPPSINPGLWQSSGACPACLQRELGELEFLVGLNQTIPSMSFYLGITSDSLNP